jgi:3-dehydroquinate synthase
VSRDPYEKGLRRKLNLGHTIGHALETMGEYRTLLHGEAVGIGLVVALHLAVRRAMCDLALAERVVGLLKSLGLPTELPKSDEEKLWNTLLLDKKTKNGKPTFVLPRKVGEVETVEGLTRHEVIETLKELKGGKR